MEPSTLIWIALAAVLGVVVGFTLGRSSGRKQGEAEGRAQVRRSLDQAAEDLAAGRLPGADQPGLSGIADALRAGWAPRGEEHRRALHEALSRIGGFLDEGVRQPLAGGRGAPAEELRERMDRALGALEDLEFFLREPDRDTSGQDVARLVQQVTREFAADQDVLVRMRVSGPVRAKVNPQAFMDGLYLILHNAGRFGGGATVDVTVTQDDGRARIVVRDRGPGFSEEAFQRAYDPFYSTADSGLGLGLPHARKAIEGMGGRIDLRNVPDGGAEVEVSLPAV